MFNFKKRKSQPFILDSQKERDFQNYLTHSKSCKNANEIQNLGNTLPKIKNKLERPPIKKRNSNYLGYEPTIDIMSRYTEKA